MIKHRLTRNGQSQRTGTIIDSTIIDDWIVEHQQENMELESFQKISQGFALSANNVTQGMYAVDNLENPTRYFVLDMQQMTSKASKVEFKSVVAGVEYDPVANIAIGDVDIHVEYGKVNDVRKNTQITVNDTRVYIVNAKTPQDLINGNYESWGAQ